MICCDYWHRAQPLGADDEIAVAEIAVHQRHLRRGTGVAVTQPAQRQFEYRPGPIKAAVFAIEIADLFRRRHLTQLGQFRRRQAVDASDDFTELARQDRPRPGKLRVAQDLACDGFALNALHDEAGAEPVLRLQHMEHPRRRQAGIVCELHQRRLRIEPGRPRGRRAIARRGAAQDRAEDAVGMHDIERPGLLAGAAGEFCSASDAGRARTPRGDAASEFFLHHFPLNFAGRFSRKAVTPSLKSSAAPALRCICCSRSS